MNDEEEEKGFLARWSQRKREAGKAEPKEAANEKPVQPTEPPPQAPGAAEPPFDLESLPKLEELTKDTDMTVFFKKGVPESIRERIAREVVAIAKDPAYQAKLRNTGFEPLGLDAQATTRMYRDEVTRWTAFIKERGLTEK